MFYFVAILVFALILYMLISSIVMRRHVLTPLANLINSISQILVFYSGRKKIGGQLHGQKTQNGIFS